MSRPWASVPNQKAPPGGSSAFIRFASMTGSVWASHGASRPATTTPANSVPPITRLAPILTAASAVLDARVDQCAEDVDERVDEEEEQHDHQDRALDDRDVAQADAVDEQRSEPGPGEQLLDDHRLADDAAELQADGGEDDDEGVAGKMPVHDLALAHALRAGGADEIGIEDLEHGRPGRAGEQRQRRDAERDRRQDDVAQAAVAV